MGRNHRKLIREGDYAAEVEVELIDSEEGWAPYLSLEDAEKLDDIRSSLQRGDVDEAAKIARVYRLMPVSA